MAFVVPTTLQTGVEKMPKTTVRFRGIPWDLIGVFLLLAVGIGTAGSLFFRNQEKQFKKQKEKELAAIANLKVRELQRWRQDKLYEAEYVSKVSYFGSIFHEWLLNPGNVRRQQDVTGALSALQVYFNYSHTFFVDTTGTLRLVLPAGGDELGSIGHDLALDVLRTPRILFSDLHAGNRDDDIHLDLVIPLHHHSEGRGGVVGALLLRIDPRRFLFPYLQLWPTPSQTAETLLVRREGNEVVFLNELRYYEGPPLRLRLPVSNIYLPAARAVLGFEGAWEGVDYRGEPVLAVGQRIPDSPWYLIAKVDVKELYSPLRMYARGVAGVALVLVVCAGVGIAFLWRRRAELYYRRELEAERRHLSLANRFASLMKQANEAILLLASDGRIVEANDQALTLYGYTREEMLGLNLSSLYAPETIHQMASDFEKARREGGWLFETLHRRKDGAEFPVENSLGLVELDGELYYHGLIRDITERKRATQRIERLNQLLRTISDVNQLIVHARNAETLCAEACWILISNNDLQSAWIGSLDFSSGRVTVLAIAGEAEDDRRFVERAVARFNNSAPGEGPLDQVIQTGRRVVIADVRRMAAFTDLGDGAAPVGLNSLAVFPIHKGDSLFGVLIVHAREPEAFEDELVTLLDELAGDLGYALKGLDDMAEHQRMEQETDGLRQLAQSSLDALAAHIAVLDAEGTILSVNAAWSRFARENGLADPLCGIGGNYFDPLQNLIEDGKETARRAERGIRDVIAGNREYFELEYPCHSPSEKRWFLMYATRFETEEGPRAVVAHENITRRYLMEEAIRESESRFRLLYEQAPVAYQSLDLEGRVLEVNHAWLDMLGYQREEILGRDFAEFLVPRHRSGLPEETFTTRFEQFKKAGRVQGIEFEMRRKDGTPLIVSIEGSIGHDARGNPIQTHCILHNITRQRREEQARHALELRLTQQQKLESIGTLASGVAHEINNPINSILNYAQLIADESPPESREQQWAEEIIRESERIAGIVRNLLQFARRDSQRPGSARLSDILATTLGLIQSVLRKDQIHLDVEVPETLPPILCRAQQIQQVFVNLLTNARDALNERYPTFHENKRVRIAAQPFEKDGISWIRITVEDRGNGIAPEHLQRIFDPFFTTKAREVNTGLGLSISHGIIKDHRGEITAESEPGNYTRFFILLPVADDVI